MINPTDSELQHLFLKWWEQSFPNVQPRSQAMMTHTAFARFILELQGNQQQEVVG
jgi:hypothetical protein